MTLDAAGLENAMVRFELFDERHVRMIGESSAVQHMWGSMPDIPSGTSFSAYADHTLKQRRKGLWVPFVIFRKSDNALAGVVAYETISRTHRRLRISHFWHPEEMRGSGLFPASQALLIERALAWGARRIAWLVPIHGQRAVQAVRSLGARDEGVLRSYSRLADGTFADMAVLSLLRDEAKAALPLINDRWKDRLAEAAETGAGA